MSSTRISGNSKLCATGEQALAAAAAFKPQLMLLDVMLQPGPRPRGERAGRRRMLHRAATCCRA
jgi:CheY-like chemotaxis protein